jgi:hypothetical protein
MEFFTNRIKITSKWTASYSSGTASSSNEIKRQRVGEVVVDDKASFDGKM